MHPGYALLAASLQLIDAILSLFVWVLIIGAVLSWLVAFNIVNPHSRAVRMVGDFIYRITEPVLRPIRRRLPPFNGLDLAPLVLIFLIMFLQSFIHHL